MPKPSTNSDWMRRTRQGSVCTQSEGPRLSSSRWSVVLCRTCRPRRRTGPSWRDCRLADCASAFASTGSCSCSRLVSSMGRNLAGPRPREDLNQLAVEGLEVVGLATGDERRGAGEVDHDLLVDP